MSILRTRPEAKADTSVENYELDHNEEISERDAADMRKLGVRQETKVWSLTRCYRCRLTGHTATVWAPHNLGVYNRDDEYLGSCVDP